MPCASRTGPAEPFDLAEPLELDLELGLDRVVGLPLLEDGLLFEEPCLELAREVGLGAEEDLGRELVLALERDGCRVAAGVLPGLPFIDLLTCAASSGLFLVRKKVRAYRCS